MAVNDDRPLGTDRVGPAPHDPASAPAADGQDGVVDRSVSTVREGVDRVAEKIKTLLGAQR